MNKSIPNNLKEARHACGLTQLQVAEKLGFKSKDRICRWEHGRMYPHIVNLLKLSMIYNKRPEELYRDLLPSLRQELHAMPSYSVVSSPDRAF